MEQIVTLASGGEVSEFAVSCPAPETTNGVLRVGMECAYEPYNWTDMDGTSLGAVPISGEGKEGLYANGYDVQIAQYIANKLGMKLLRSTPSNGIPSSRRLSPAPSTRLRQA